MADLPGSREADNLDIAIKRAYEALMEAESAVNRIERVRSMPGSLDLFTTILEAREAFERAAVAFRAVMLGSNDQLHSSSTQDRVSGQVRGNGD